MNSSPLSTIGRRSSHFEMQKKSGGTPPRSKTRNVHGSDGHVLECGAAVPLLLSQIWRTN
jgi:hypothetical protein